MNFPESSSDGFPHHPERKQHKGAALKCARAAGGEEGAGMVAPAAPNGEARAQSLNLSPTAQSAFPYTAPTQTSFCPNCFLDTDILSRILTVM